jgi:hypothetical protein
MTEERENRTPDCWFVLVCGLPLAADNLNLGRSFVIRRLVNPLSVFDLAAAGAVGFREWAVLEPLAASATAEMVSPKNAADTPGYDALNKCWLASALLVLRGYARHICPAASSYSWNFIAGHQKQTSDVFRDQLHEEGVDKAVFEPRAALPRFQGGLLDYHLRVYLPREAKAVPLSDEDAEWIRNHFERFNRMAAEDERFRFALESAVDWRYAKDSRAAIARLWAGIESLFGISSELVHRVSIFAATVLEPRGAARVDAFKRLKKLYGMRSKAVHGEPLKDEELVESLQQSYDILRSLLLDAISRGRVRGEDDYLQELLG